MRDNYNSVVIMGPTAVGKTRVAVDIAVRTGGIVVSADSRQVYRGMDIGTGKDLEAYRQAGVEYKMIDIKPAGSKYDLWNYLNDAEVAIQEAENRGHLPVICGGTGLYLQALIQDYKLAGVPPDRQLRERLNALDDNELTQLYEQTKVSGQLRPDTRARLIRAIERTTVNTPDNIRAAQRNRKYLIFCLTLPRPILLERIYDRLDERLASGMVEEVAGLINTGIPAETLKYYGLEYRIVTEHLAGEINADEMREKLRVGIAQYAKRQMTWFRKMERDGLDINWIDCYNEDATELIMKSLAHTGV